MNVYSFTKEDLEENYDSAKTAIIDVLVKEGYLEYEEAEEWCRTHTVILRKKNVFRTLTNLWEKAKQSSTGYYILVVKSPDEDFDEENEKEPLPIDKNGKVV